MPRKGTLFYPALAEFVKPLIAAPLSIRGLETRTGFHRNKIERFIQGRTKHVHTDFLRKFADAVKISQDEFIAFVRNLEDEYVPVQPTKRHRQAHGDGRIKSRTPSTATEGKDARLGSISITPSRLEKLRNAIEEVQRLAQKTSAAATHLKGLAEQIVGGSEMASGSTPGRGPGRPTTRV